MKLQNESGVNTDSLIPALREASSANLIRAVILSLPLIVKLLVFPTLVWFVPVSAVLFCFWEWLFTRRRNLRVGYSWLFYTMLFCLLLPVETALWQMILAGSFGAVLGEQIYGGRGHSFTSPVVLGLAFLFYSFDFPTIETATELVGISYLVLFAGGAIALYYRLSDWIPLLAIVSAYTVLAFVSDTSLQLPAVPIAACVLFCACDSTLAENETHNLSIGHSRILYGLLVGGLIYLFDPSVVSLEKVVFAILLGNITSPFLGWIANTLHHSAVKSTGRGHV